MTTPDVIHSLLVRAPRDKKARASCPFRFGDKKALTCGNAERLHLLVPPVARRPILTQNRRSEAFLSRPPYGRGGSSGHPPPHPVRRAPATSRSENTQMTTDTPTTTRSCRVCGCTDNTPCTGPNDYACWWIEPDLCSQCRPHAEACS